MIQTTYKIMERMQTTLETKAKDRGLLSFVDLLPIRE